VDYDQQGLVGEVGGQKAAGVAGEKQKSVRIHAICVTSYKEIREKLWAIPPPRPRVQWSNFLGAPKRL